MLSVLYVEGTRSNRSVNLEKGEHSWFEVRWLTVLSDVEETVFVEPCELDVEGVYSIE